MLSRGGKEGEETMKHLTIFLITSVMLWTISSNIFTCPACLHHDSIHPNIENIPPHMTVEEFCKIYGLDPQIVKTLLLKKQRPDWLDEDESPINPQDFMGIGDVEPNDKNEEN
jgi:hypothetical protein